MNVTQLAIFTAGFLLVAGLGFAAAHWRRPADMAHLHEWGLGGRSFGPWVTWFLIGGDLYTAYTFVAVPALVFGAGAMGFFAVPYTVVTYPLVFLVLIRLWSVAHRHGFVTPADFVRARFDSPTLALAVAVTGLVATMPYIALQLVGIEAVLKTMGVTGHWPIVLAFAVLAAYTYRSGLRAPALIAFVKDTLIYVVILAAVLYIPYRLGGWSTIFDAAARKFAATPAAGDGLLLQPGQHLQYVTLAFGSALALFLYPHSVTGVLASRSRDAVKRNMAALPAYSLLLGLIALLGFMAIAAGVTPIGTDTNTVVPQLFDRMFPDWFTGVAFTAIGIGALVPAAIMSIAAANLFTRNIYKEYLRPGATPAQEATVSKVASLLVKVGAVLCILLLEPQFSIDLQLIGGVIMLQTLPAVALGLFTRWFHRGALLAGWAVGLAAGLAMLYATPNAAGTRQHFGGSAFALSHLGPDTKLTVYAGFVAVLLNLAVAALGTLVLRRAGVPAGTDRTAPDDYDAEAPADLPQQRVAAATTGAATH
ncbi:solute:Na+ symporter, SSS family protein [Pilimelia anulata]|uniref:Solute:Na+ symporter, SSS family protein n=1 Tax=Pilimelia anulata TaxID=53371 RepID=A0A8J3BAJ1_9ACTN|nr:sodium:solute symporter [Pilimelia anulata]GGK00948.1 solute:Na+ symporter, SSS family protein [Pilimelia anulata]